MNKDQPNLEKSFALISEIAVLLMQSGANTKRVIDNLNRFARALNLKSYALISHKSIIITLKDRLDMRHTYTNVIQIPSYRMNFYIVSEISRLSWVVSEEQWDGDVIQKEIDRIKNTPQYSFGLTALVVSLAGASFAKLFGGDYESMLIAFVATLAGMFTVKLALSLKLNPYLQTYLAALTASVIASLGILLHLGDKPNIALATSVLFLVPGVPLVNSFNDLYNNHILNGSVRFISGFMTVLFIGLGLITAMVLFNTKL